MKKARWTSGPWEYTYRAIVTPGNNMLRLSGVCMPCGYVPDEDQSYDNARLVATAPEMYEVLKDFLRWSKELARYAGSQWADDSNLSQECHWLNETRKEALLVLAKARGESDAT